MALFATSKEAFLRGFLKLEKGVPSHDTFSRLFRLLDPKQFGSAFGRFMASFSEAPSQTWRKVGDQLRPRIRKLAELMDEAEADVIAFMGFPKSHWPKLHLTNPIERLNKEVKRRADVVGILPNGDSIKR